MEKKRVVPIWVGIVLLVLCAVSIYACLLSLINETSTMMAIADSLFICATVLAVLYGVLNYSKKAHWVFLVFSIVFTVALLIGISSIASGSLRAPLEGIGNAPATPELPDSNSIKMPPNDNSKCISTIVSTVMFACMFTLTIAKDLGKKKSYALILVMMIGAFYFAIRHINTSESIYILADVNITIFVLSLIYGIMIYAKYKDKESRGTK